MFSQRNNARSMLTKSLSNKLLFMTLVDQGSNLSTSDIVVVTFLRLYYVKFGVIFICQKTIFFLKILLVLYDNVKYFTWLTSESFSHLSSWQVAMLMSLISKYGHCLYSTESSLVELL